ncbi:MAG: FAD-dependent oxidoreductase [Spirochaetales bacterium]|nr:FAD-dependent oxidoreductase [Spirochaetales bacterium]
MSRTYDVVVVGAGSAGFSAAAAARDTDATASVLLVNGEDRLPYKRTKISKHIATGFERDQFALRDEAWYRDNRIERLDGVALSAIERDAHRLSFDQGVDGVEYGRLVLALGSEPIFPRVVRSHERGSFFVLRSASDGEHIRRRASKIGSVLIAGMGVLAVELASQLRDMGKRVTLAGATPQLMPRQLNARAGEILEDVLIRNGVKLLFQEEILSFEENKKHSWNVEMLKHSAQYDMVIFCIGVEPRSGIAAKAGVEVGRGITVDESMRTSDEAIYAAGDCAEHGEGRISHLWHDAEDQGRVAGINAAGGTAVLAATSYRLKCEAFNQYLFSIRKPREPWDFYIDEFEIDARYYAFYWNTEGRLHGAVMLNDADRAKMLQQAAIEGWDRNRLMSAVGLD